MPGISKEDGCIKNLVSAANNQILLCSLPAALQTAKKPKEKSFNSSSHTTRSLSRSSTPGELKPIKVKRRSTPGTNIDLDSRQNEETGTCVTFAEAAVDNNNTSAGAAVIDTNNIIEEGPEVNILGKLGDCVDNLTDKVSMILFLLITLAYILA
ncbi:unnamed protein product [Protopolystoma xenopodis]|uniref:Uncharacterized protein n=1 Tax=Protopolystoma xenopodis TaxID=117903 RepID=A0A448X2R0_9PLAT|nr:unnamed protein product [Protopolystoma xenopodis]